MSGEAGAWRAVYSDKDEFAWWYYGYCWTLYIRLDDASGLGYWLMISVDW